MTLEDGKAAGVEPSDPAGVCVSGAGDARAGECAVHSPHFEDPLLALPLIIGGEARRLGGISGLSVKEPPGTQTTLVAGIWGCVTLSACDEGRDDACVHSLLPVPAAPDLDAERDGRRMVSSAHSHAVLSALARVTTAPLPCPGMDSLRAAKVALPHLRASATVAVLGVGGLWPLAVQVLRASTASRIVAIDTAAMLRLAAARDGSPGGAASRARAMDGLMQAPNGLAVRSGFDVAGRLANAIVANYGALVAAGRGTGSFLIDGGAGQASHGKPR